MPDDKLVAAIKLLQRSRPIGDAHLVISKRGGSPEFGQAALKNFREWSN